MYGPIPPQALAILMVWLYGPALIITVLAQLWWFKRMNVLRRSQFGRVALALAWTVVLTPIVSIPLWAVTPDASLPKSVWPEGRLTIPPVFLPAIVSCVVIGSLVTWWVVRGTSNSTVQQTGARDARPGG